MKTGSLFSRLAKGALSQVYGQGVNAFIQLVNVPLMLAFWGQQLFGEWLLLTAMPSYLLFCDLGFSATTNREMTILVGRNETKAALGYFQSGFAMTLALACLVLLVAAAAAWLIPLADIFSFEIVTQRDILILLPLLALQVVLGVQASLMTGGLVCEGRYGESYFLLSSSRVVEFAMMWLFIAFGAGPLGAVLAAIGGKLLSMIAIFVMVKRFNPWIKYGFSQAKLSIIRSIFMPALATLGLSLSNALNIQGLRMTVGYLMGPAAVVVFTTMRTLTRIVAQAFMAINKIITPELGASFGADDMDSVQVIHRRACQISFWIALGCAVALAAFGGTIFDLWVQDQIVVDWPTFYLLLLVTMVNALWQTSFMVEVATNRHVRSTGRLLGLNAATVATSLLLIHLAGLPGAAASLFILEIGMTIRVIPASLRYTNDTFLPFLRTVLRPPLFLLPSVWLVMKKTWHRIGRTLPQA